MKQVTSEKEFAYNRLMKRGKSFEVIWRKLFTNSS